MSWAYDFQAAVRAALTGEEALAGWPVVDGGVAGLRPPFVTLGPDLMTDESGVAARLVRLRFAVTLWAGGESVAGLKPAMAAAEQAVLASDPDLPGAALVRLSPINGRTRRDARAGLVRGDLDFEAMVQIVDEEDA